MAGQPEADRKARLIAELERSRSDIAHNLRGVRAGLDVGQHLRHAFFRQKTAWLGAAALGGWVLSRLPFRKKAPKPALSSLFSRKTSSSEKKDDRNKLLLALLSLAGTMIKPVVTRYLTQKVGDFAANRHNGSHKPRW